MLGKDSEMVLIINAVSDTVERAVAWISLQPDGAVSVGLVDRAFISPKFHARQFVWNAYNRVTLQYLVPHSPDELVAVANPHLTFHPPIYFHFRANNDEELFAGLAQVEIMLQQDGRVPWVRFVSKPVRDIPQVKTPRDPTRTETLTAKLESTDCSLGIGIDFVRRENTTASGSVLDHFMDCGPNRLHVFCDQLPPQEATLAWYHQY
jgi:hypothetical protein